MVSLLGAGSQIFGTVAHIFNRNEPLTRENLQKRIHSYDPWCEYDTLTTPECIDMATRAVRHAEVGVREDGCKLFQAILNVAANRKTAYEPALKAALVAVSDRDNSVRSKGLKIFECLVSLKYVCAYEPAMKAAQETHGDPNIDVRLSGLLVYRSLVTSLYRSAYEPAIQAMQAAIDDRVDRTMINLCGQIFSHLFYPDNYFPAYEAATTMARIATSHTNAEVRERGVIDLYGKLVDCKYEPAYAAATEVARAAVYSENIDESHNGWWLFERLIKADYADAYESAITLLREGVMYKGRGENDSYYYMKGFKEILQQYETRHLHEPI